MIHPLDALRTDAGAILRAAVDAIDPRPLVRSALQDHPFLDAYPGTFTLIAAGKAAGPMADAALSTLGMRTRRALVAAPADSTGNADTRVERYRASHPLPDEQSVAAGTRALEFAAEARARNELLLVLLSGGASSMLCAPVAGVALEDKTRVVADLMRAGVDIVRLNTVRKHLSRIKGGRLAVAAGRSLTLAISDVHRPEDDPASIGSGPTSADPSTFADALAVLRDSGVNVPPAVEKHLLGGVNGRSPETPKPFSSELADALFAVIANRRLAMDGAAREARRLGYVVHVMEPPTRGEARDAGRIFAELALAARPVAGPMCAIASGEPTVAVRGDGRGGRNQEFVLGAAATLARKWELALIASVGTDGVDGPTDASGAIATSATMSRAAAAGLDIAAALDRNDAYPLLSSLDDLIRWGPTGTNVGDVHILLTGGR